jgi:hypothetical protein
MICAGQCLNLKWRHNSIGVQPYPQVPNYVGNMMATYLYNFLNSYLHEQHNASLSKLYMYKFTALTGHTPLNFIVTCCGLFQSSSLLQLYTNSSIVIAIPEANL